MIRTFVTVLLFLVSTFSVHAKKIETVDEYRVHLKKTMDKKKTSLKKKCVKDKKTKGKMVLLWEVDENGKAADFSRGKDTVDNSDIYHCYEKEISKMKFEKPPQDQVVEIEYEFSF